MSSWMEIFTDGQQQMSSSGVDITQITLRSDLLSQIRGRVVVLRDRIHEEIRHTKDVVVMWLN